MNRLFFLALLFLVSCHDSGPLPDPGPDPEPDPGLKLKAINDWVGGTYTGSVIYEREYYDLAEMQVKFEIDTFINKVYVPEVTPCSNNEYELNIGELIPFPIGCFPDSFLLGDSIVNYTHYASFSQELHWHVQDGRIVTYYHEFYPGSYHTIAETIWKDFRRP